jgi:hypothetical protein
LAVTAVALTLVFTSTAPAASRFRERQARAILSQAIRTGVPIYNDGDYRDCYRIYEGALRSVLPLIDSREIRDDIRSSLRRAHRQSSASDRAWTLRRAIDRTLNDLD